MEGGGEWSTIDRKKKKSKQEKEVEEGWEQVPKKQDRRSKNKEQGNSVAPEQGAGRGRGGDRRSVDSRGGGYRGGHSDRGRGGARPPPNQGGRGGTLPRNPRGRGNATPRGGGRGTATPSPVPSTTLPTVPAKVATPPITQPTPTPPPQNTWASKISSSSSSKESSARQSPETFKVSPAPEQIPAVANISAGPKPSLVVADDKSQPTTPPSEVKLSMSKTETKQLTPEPEVRPPPAEIKPAVSEEVDSTLKVSELKQPTQETEVKPPAPTAESKPVESDVKISEVSECAPALQEENQTKLPSQDLELSNESLPEYKLSPSAPEFKPPAALLSAEAPEFKPPPSLLAAIPLPEKKLSPTAPLFTPASFRQPEVADPTLSEVADPTPPEVADPTPPEVADPTPPEIVDPTPIEVEPTLSEVSESTPPKVSEPTPPEVSDPTPTEVSEPTPPEVSEPTSSELTNPSPQGTLQVTDLPPPEITDLAANIPTSDVINTGLQSGIQEDNSIKPEESVNNKELQSGEEKEEDTAITNKICNEQSIQVPEVSSSVETSPVNATVNILPKVEPTQETDVKSSDEAGKPVVSEAPSGVLDTPIPDSTDNVIEKTNSTVISNASLADTNGNFQTDDNENITTVKSIITDVSKSAEEEINVEPMLTNGEVEVNDKLNEINDNIVNEKPIDENGISEEEKALTLPYRDDQWSPANTDGKKQYDRDFLLQLQTNPLSMQKPQKMPDMEIILPEPDILRSVSSAPNLAKFDMTPQYIKSSTSHNRGTPNRRDSRRKESSTAAARLNGPPVKVINLTREEVSLSTTENAWKPAPKKDKDAASDEPDDLVKKIRSILNKLCPQKFDVLVGQFQELPIDSLDKLTSSMELVFEKALDEPSFSVAYARMCQALMMKKVTDSSGKDVNFRTLLITRCQKEFLKDYMEDLDRDAFNDKLAKAEDNAEKKKITAVFNAQELRLRKRSLGNIRFIGELYRISMLNGRIMHEIVRKLLKTTDEESLECLCRMLTTVGAQFEKETATVLMSPKPLAGFSPLDVYFTNMNTIVGNKNISSRVRFIMQDVIDLRRAKWVGRRKEAGPKTIEQIHEEVKKEATQAKLNAMTPDPPPSRRSDDRGDRRRSQRLPPKERPPKDVQGDGWNNVPEKAARMNKEKIDTSKLRISKVDINSIQLGPPGGSRPGGGFSSWGRGAAAAGANKKFSVQEPPAPKQVNRFAMLNDEDDSNSMPPPSNTYHGRASEPAYRPGAGYGARDRSNSRDLNNSFSGRSSREGSQNGRSNSREGYSDKGSRTGSGDGSKVAKQVINEGVAGGLLKGKSNTDMDTLESKTKPILDEFLHNRDIGEAFLCISELYHENTIGHIVEIVFNNVLERSSKDRSGSATLFSYLLKNESLPYSKFLAGCRGYLEFAEDIQIDIPKFWAYLAEMISNIVLTKTVDAIFLVDAPRDLDSSLRTKFSAAMLACMGSQDQAATAAVWQQSGISLNDLGVADGEKFLEENQLEFLNQTLSNGVKEEVVVVEQKEQSLADKLSYLLSNKEQTSQLIELVQEHVKDPTALSFIRTLVNQVIESCLNGMGGSESITLNDDKLKTVGMPILKRYLDAVKEREVEALYSLQALVNRLEHPNKLLHSIFDVLYECDVISEDAFMEWEVSDLPGEQEGKGVALKSCTQFFEWLKTAEPEDDEEQAKVNFQLGGEEK